MTGHEFSTTEPSSHATSGPDTPAPGTTRRTTSGSCAPSTATDVASVVLETVEDDHRICANCFRVIREIATVEERVAADGDASAPALPTPETQSGVAQVGQSSIPRPKQVCDCGAAHHRTRLRCASKETAVERAGNLSTAVDALRDAYRDADAERLRRRVETWAHSTDALEYAMGAFKSRPALQGHRDTALYRRALAVALRRPGQA